MPKYTAKPEPPGSSNYSIIQDNNGKVVKWGVRNEEVDQVLKQMNEEPICKPGMVIPNPDTQWSFWFTLLGERVLYIHKSFPSAYEAKDEMRLLVEKLNRQEE